VRGTRFDIIRQHSNRCELNGNVQLGKEAEEQRVIGLGANLALGTRCSAGPAPKVRSRIQHGMGPDMITDARALLRS
jgi:hypothetical protein